MPPPAKTKTSRTKKRETSKVRIQLGRAENPLSSLGLTARETEVLSWIAQGKTNYEIGVVLSACTGTICKHVEHILCKLKIKNRTAAAVIALAALAKTENMNQRMRWAGCCVVPRTLKHRFTGAWLCHVRSQDLLRRCLARIRTA